MLEMRMSEKCLDFRIMNLVLMDPSNEELSEFKKS